MRAAVQAAEARRHQRRSAAAVKAGVTRARRLARKVYDVSRGIIDGHVYGPRTLCVICGKGLSDVDSITRGIGSDCWQRVLIVIEQRRALQLAESR